MKVMGRVMSSPKHTDGHDDFAGLLRRYLEASLYSYGQLALLSGVPKRTIVNWLDGTVKNPRHWQSVVRVAAALRLSLAQTDELLVAISLPPIHTLAQQTGRPEELSLLATWALDPVAAEARHTQLLRTYLETLIVELAHLPAYFPRHTAFTFATIYQDVRLRRVEQVEVSENPRSILTNDGELWSELRRQQGSAVILGQPGMGKTWLFKAEAMQLAQEALLSGGDGGLPALPLLIRLPELATLVREQRGLQSVLHVIAELAARQTPTLPEAETVAALYAFMEKYPERVAYLLDALDEVPGRDGLRNAARRVVVQLGTATRSRLLLSSRTLGYTAAPLGRYLGSNIAELEIAPFTEREIERVMRAWFHGRTELQQRLHTAMRRAPALVRQATNPLLLSLICMLNETRGEELAGSRSGLYEPVLRLLLEGRWRSFELQLPEGRVRSKLRVLEAIAWCYATFRHSWWEQLPGDVLDEAIEALPDAQRLWTTWRAEWGLPYEGPLWELSEWDGILIKGFLPIDGAASAVPYAFLHRTFQEFLVARYLLRRYADAGLGAPEVQEFLAGKACDPEWFVVLLHLVEQLTLYPLPNSQPLLDRLSDILLAAVQNQTGQMAVAAAELLLNLPLHDTASDIASVTDKNANSEVVRLLRERLLQIMRDAAARPIMRVHAGRLMAELGEPRLEIMDVDAIQFVEVPAGDFLMGSDPGFDADSLAEELPQHLFSVEHFCISRFPISNAQYRTFYDDKEDGYDNPAYWPEAIALGHWQNGMVWRMRHKGRADGTVALEPTWMRALNQTGWPTDLPNGPVMGISWYEARAFVRWLERRWRRSGVIAPTTRLDLPSEAEWEKTARGVDGRIYPWGNTFDGNRLNWYGHMLMAPAPIGTFPDSASPYGA